MLLASWGPEEWTAFGTVATAAVAVAAATVALFQLREVKRTRREQTQPYVVVDFVPSRVGNNILNVAIENIGRTPARDVRVTFDPTIRSSLKDYDIEATAMFSEPIRSMPPGRRIEVLFDVGHERFKTDLPSRYNITVQASDSRGRPLEDTRYVVDFGYLYGVQYIREKGVHDIANAVDQIAKTMKSWTARQRLNVGIHDEDERSQRDRIHHDLTGRWPSLATSELPQILMTIGRLWVRWTVQSWRRLATRFGSTRTSVSGEADPPD